MGQHLSSLLCAVTVSLSNSGFSANKETSMQDWGQFLGEIGKRCTVEHARFGSIREERADGQRLYSWCVCKKPSIPKEQQIPFPSFQEERRVPSLFEAEDIGASAYWDQFQDRDCRMVVFRT